MLQRLRAGVRLTSLGIRQHAPVPPQCPDGCATCRANGTCASCWENYSLVGGKCSPVSRRTLWLSAAACHGTHLLQVPYGPVLSHACVRCPFPQCPFGCIDCSGDSTRCRKCMDTLSKSADGQCLPCADPMCDSECWPRAGVAVAAAPRCGPVVAVPSRCEAPWPPADAVCPSDPKTCAQCGSGFHVKDGKCTLVRHGDAPAGAGQGLAAARPRPPRTRY